MSRVTAEHSVKPQLTIATWLVEHGFSVIPLDHPDATHQTDPKRIGKAPVTKWEMFQTAKPTPDNLQAWFGNGTPRNVAIVMGTISNIVAVDGDSPEGLAWMREHLPATEMRTKTARGEHWFFRHPGVLVPNKSRLRTNSDQVKVDVRGDGGYVVAPGSKHATGVIYERDGSWPSVDALPVFDPAWLGSVSQGTITVTDVSEDALPDRERRLRRARAYVSRVPPAVEGQGGDTHTFQLACKLVRGFALEEGDALELLRAWNVGCIPPWTDRELEAKIASARKHGTEPIGGRVVEQRAFNATTTTTLGPTVFPLTDTGNAEAFAAWYGDRVLFDHRRGRWLVWRGHRWSPDADAEVDRLAKEAIRRRQVDAAEIEDTEKRKLALKWTLSSESSTRRLAMLTLAKTERPIADAGDGWDTDPLLLGVPNGVVELRTGTVRPGRPSDRITMTTAVSADLNAPAPLWERTIREVLNDDADLVMHVQKALGYSLTGITTEQKAWMGTGAGSNGKGTIFNAIRNCLGDYAYQMPFSTLLHTHHPTGSNDLAALDGKRFVLASEVNEGLRFDEARVKALTGCDPITARFLYAEYFTFRPVAKFWLSTNHKPIVKDDSHAFWRRIHLVPFLRTFPVNPDLEDALAAEAVGILAWLIRGCLLWQAEGLGVPQVIAEATQTYQRDSDVLGDFIETCCKSDETAEISGAELYKAYTAWAERQGLTERERLTSTMFGRKASERLPRGRTSRGARYRVRVTGFSSEMTG